MLTLNIKRVFELRGIERPYSVLVKNGISRPTATNLLNNRVQSIKTNHLELICEILSCEPNDLYEWKPTKSTRNVKTHPLKDLIRRDTKQNFSEIMKTIPLEKMDDIQNMLKEFTGD